MKEYRVEFTEQGNGYCYTGGWDTEIVEAETAEEAVELLRANILENGGNPNDFIYRVR